MSLRVLRRAEATADFFSAADHLEDAGGRTLAHDFSVALQRALDRLAAFPHIGRRVGFGPPDLRAWPVRRFSYLIFYIPHADSIDVIRILHAARDVPREFGDFGKSKPDSAES